MLIRVSLLLLVATVCGCASTPPTTHSIAERNKEMVREAFQAMQDGNLETLNYLTDPEGTWHTLSRGDVRMGGPHSNLKDACPMCAALAQRSIRVNLIIAENDLVAVRSTWSGIYSGEYRGVSVVDKPLTIVYDNIYRVVDGKIRENWANVDRSRILEQLGIQVIPTSAK